MLLYLDIHECIFKTGPVQNSIKLAVLVRLLNSVCSIHTQCAQSVKEALLHTAFAHQILKGPILSKFTNSAMCL